MTSVRSGALLVGAFGFLSALALAVLFVHMKVSDTAWVSGMGAIVALAALANSILIFALADERARFANAFEIAAKWDAAPVLGARDVIRPHQKDLMKLEALMESDTDVTAAVVHLVNFYWNLASAIEVKRAQEGYLKLRFRHSLDAVMPLLQAWKRVTSDKSSGEALASITRLQNRWATRPT